MFTAQMLPNVFFIAMIVTAMRHAPTLKAVTLVLVREPSQETGKIVQVSIGKNCVCFHPNSLKENIGKVCIHRVSSVCMTPGYLRVKLMIFPIALLLQR